LREIPSNDDGDFSEQKLRARYTADLQNSLGNLASRLAALIEKHLDGVVPYHVQSPKVSEHLEENIVNFRLHEALAEIWENIAWANQYIDRTKLWELPKKDRQLFEHVISSLVALIKQVALELSPFLPQTAEKLDQIFRAEKIVKTQPLFPPLE
jgi:methionyl-tRNA synthetase